MADKLERGEVIAVPGGHRSGLAVVLDVNEGQPDARPAAWTCGAMSDGAAA